MFSLKDLFTNFGRVHARLYAPYLLRLVMQVLVLVVRVV